MEIRLLLIPVAAELPAILFLAARLGERLRDLRDAYRLVRERAAGPNLHRIENRLLQDLARAGEEARELLERRRRTDPAAEEVAS